MSTDKTLPLWFVCIGIEKQQQIYLHVRHETMVGAVTLFKDELKKILTNSEIESMRVVNVYEVTA